MLGKESFLCVFLLKKNVILYVYGKKNVMYIDYVIASSVYSNDNVIFGNKVKIS